MRLVGVALVVACSNPGEVPVPPTSPASHRGQPLTLEPRPTSLPQQRSQKATTGILRFAPAQDNGQRDLLSPDVYQGDGARDHAFDLAIDSPQKIRHLLVVVRGMGQQWDTVIDQDPTPAFSELPNVHGGRTWHLGVQEAGRWVTRTRDGSMPLLAAGHHDLHLYADWSGGYEDFTALAQLEDGSYLEASTQMPRR